MDEANDCKTKDAGAGRVEVLTVDPFVELAVHKAARRVKIFPDRSFATRAGGARKLIKHSDVLVEDPEVIEEHAKEPVVLKKFEKKEPEVLEKLRIKNQ